MEKGFKKRILGVAVLAAMWQPAPSLAYNTASAPYTANSAYTADSAIEGAKMCTRNISRYERYYGIPTHLLSAISATETGRYHQGLKIALPWPWTINVEGKGFFFDTKAEAIAAVRTHQMRGAKSIDVGCMQVNLHHHPDAFANLDDAFDPERNVAYGANFLRTLYEENKSWKTAAAYYHSRTPSRGSQYMANVYDRWYNIIDRLRAVKADIPASTVAAMNEQTAVADQMALAKPAATVNPKIIPVQPKVVAALPEQRGRDVKAYQSPRMNTISISQSDDKRDQGVLVIRPKITVVNADSQPTMTVASQTPVSGEITGAHVIRVAQGVQKTAEARPAGGPRFIFEN